MESNVMVVAKCNADSLRPWRDKKKITLNKKSIGSLIRIDDQIYVLTCYHGVRNSIQTIIQQLVKNTNNRKDKQNDNKKGDVLKSVVTLCAIAPELDLALYKTDVSIEEVDRNKTKYYLLEDFEKGFPESDSKAIMNIFKLRHTTETNVELLKEKHICRCQGVYFDQQNAYNMPVMPIISIDFDNNKNMSNIENLSGTSGTLVVDPQKQVLGMVSFIDTEISDISLVPSITIHRFLLEYKMHKVYNGLCGIFVKLDDEHNVMYSVNVLNNKHKIKIGDKIVSVGDNKLGKDGKIFDKNLRINIPYETFIALNYFSDEKIPIVVKRKNKQVTINFKIPAYDSILKVPYVNHNDYLNLDGLILMELSEELIELYSNFGLTLSVGTVSNMINEPYRSIGSGLERVVVIVDIISNGFNKDMKEKLDKFKIMNLDRNSNEISLPVVNLVSNKKVLNLSNLNIKTKGRLTLTTTIDMEQSLKFIYENSKLVDIKKVS